MLDAAVRNGHCVASAYIADLARVLRLVPEESLNRLVRLLLDARVEGRRVYVIGNGGSAATASHFVNDLMKTASVRGHRPIRAFSLSDNTPLLTAWANDVAYEQVFAEQVSTLVDPDDIVIAFSASGSSANIIAAIRAAATKGARTVGILGFDGGIARDLVDVMVHVPCHDYGLVEDSHLAIGHAVTSAIRETLQVDGGS